MKQAGGGAYDGTTFHRMVKYGMVQGGDPLSKDPSKRALYGTGGQNMVKAEPRAAKMTRGSVAAVLVPGKPDSAGAQFFIVVADQPGARRPVHRLRPRVGRHGGRAEDLRDAGRCRRARDRARGDSQGDRSRHAAARAGAVLDRDAQELASYRAVLDTSAGPIAIELFPDKAPAHVRQFLRLAQAGVYDGMAFHRVAPGFVIQTGARSSRAAPLTEKQQKLVHNLQPEFNDTKHVKGIVSMARGDDPASATTSFFICTAASAPLDGHYTAFGRVVDGMAAVDAIEAAPRNGETPTTRIELKTVRVERPVGPRRLGLGWRSHSCWRPPPAARIESLHSIRMRRCASEIDVPFDNQTLELHLSRPRRDRPGVR